jgi:hypothetical protein
MTRPGLLASACVALASVLVVRNAPAMLGYLRNGDTGAWLVLFVCAAVALVAAAALIRER